MGSSEQYFIEYDTYSYRRERRVLARDHAFVFQPSVGAEINIGAFMRASLYGGYRTVSAVNFPQMEQDMLDGFVFGGALKFGNFKPMK